MDIARCWTTNQAARFLSCTPRTIRAMIQRKDLHGVRFGRDLFVLISEVEEMSPRDSRGVKSDHAIGGEGVGAKLRFTILERDGFTCQYCGRSAPSVVLHVDHIIPRSIGGPAERDNLITACETCNVGKRDQILSVLVLMIAWRVRFQNLV